MRSPTLLTCRRGPMHSADHPTPTVAPRGADNAAPRPGVPVLGVTYYIRDVRELRFERSDDYAFNQDLVTFRALLRTDGDLIDATGAIKHYLGGAS